MAQTLTQKKKSRVANGPPSNTRVGALKKAHSAVITLRTLKPFLTPQDEETLTIMMDKELMTSLKKSITEAKARKLEPLERILA